MKVRSKFSKIGRLKYIGHLDVMRFFQKAIRRAALDVSYSEGFSPHMLMSFAQPLGVGLTSEAEYFDLDLISASSSAEMIRLLNEQMPPEIRVLSIVRIPEDKANKCMSLVSAADYSIRFENSDILSYRDAIEKFLSADEINIVKKTKRSETLTDIKPLILRSGFSGGELQLMLAAGSVNNLNPRLVLTAFFDSQRLYPDSIRPVIHRRELYALTDDGYTPLDRLGEEIL